jgi:hypothetical protein
MAAKGVRTNQYTYLVKKDGTYQLFDNLKDPYQMNSISLENIPLSKANDLKKDLGNWLKKAHDKWYNKKMNANLIDYPKK